MPMSPVAACDRGAPKTTMASGSGCLSSGSEWLVGSWALQAHTTVARSQASFTMCAPPRPPNVKKLCVVEGFTAGEEGSLAARNALPGDTAIHKASKGSSKGEESLASRNALPGDTAIHKASKGSSKGEEGSHKASQNLSAVKEFAQTAATAYQTADGKFWRIESDPFAEFDCPILIWNRSVYDDFVGLIQDEIKNGFKRFIILGTAGIGKSWFSITWMLQLAKEGCQVVLKVHRGFYILDFAGRTASGPFLGTEPLMEDALNNRMNWLMIDGEQPGRLDCRCKVLQACSTKPANFEEFGKHQFTYKLYMPVWSRQETVQFLEDFEPYREQYKAMGINDKQSVLKMYGKLGGVARYILPRTKGRDGLVRLRTAINQFSSDVDKALNALSGGFIKDMSDRLVHIKCPKDTYDEPVYDFASSAVKRLILHQVQLAADVKIKQLLSATVYKPEFGTMWGSYFEVLVHRLLTRGCVLQRKKVDASGGSCPVETVKCPPFEPVLIGGMAELKQNVAEGVYVKPQNKNFPVADAFLGKKVLIQVFKRQKGDHPYKLKGLMEIDEMLQQEHYELWACVLPELFERTRYQKYIGIDGKVCKAHSFLQKLTQYVVCVDYTSI